MKIIELVIDRESDGVDCISLVSRPAIKEDFYAFNGIDGLESYVNEMTSDQNLREVFKSEEELVELCVLMYCFENDIEDDMDDDFIKGLTHSIYNTNNQVKMAKVDQRTAVGPVMIPDMKIMRLDDEKKPYYVKFSTETIKECAIQYAEKLRLKESNIEHSDIKTDVVMFESWIVEDSEKDKSNFYGYSLPVGTWFGCFKINDDPTWELIKEGKLKGFSVEGFFTEKVV